MPINTKLDAKQIRQRRFLNKDFDSLRSDLLLYAKTHYGDKVKNFSETSLGGLFLDMAAYVGDVFSFYGDYQFGEVFAETATEKKNVEKLLRDAGVEIVGNSPAVVSLNWYIEVPASRIGMTFQPRTDAIPIIEQGSVAQADTGVRFELVENLDFSEKDGAGNFKAEIALGNTNADGTPISFIMKRSGQMVSGFTNIETFTIPNNFVAFRQITLSFEDITDIISVVDTSLNNYYKVSALSQDTVFKAISNINEDNELVPMNLEIIPAPYRFVANMDLDTKLTTLTFGGGSASSLDNDIIPDPSELSLPLYGKTTFSRFSIDPNKLLETRTLGISPQNTVLTVQYRYGGGLSHNVAAGTINTATKILMKFPGNPDANIATDVKRSVSVKNIEFARGGENAPSINELKTLIPSAKNSQKRIVSREDLLARAYTMPSSFGRIFRAGVRDNPDNPLSTILYVVSRDQDKKLTISPDTLKRNLVKYLNEFRMVAEAFDILDARVINLSLQFQIVADANANKGILVKNIISRLKKFFDISNFQIDQPIRIDEIRNIIFNTQGVISLIDLKLSNLIGDVDGKSYSNITFDVKANTKNNMIIGPPGSIFEIRYPNIDIVGSAI